MDILVFDSESDGFVEEATQLWCIAMGWYGEEDTELFPPDKVESGLFKLHTADVLVCHNEKKHDLPLFKKLYGWEPKSHQIILDTLTYSRMLNPKRPAPAGYYGKAVHSIEAWGYRVGRGKPEHEDWSKYTEDMGHRCREDVEINRLMLKELEREVEGVEMFYNHTKTISLPLNTK